MLCINVLKVINKYLIEQQILASLVSEKVETDKQSYIKFMQGTYTLFSSFLHITGYDKSNCE